jgi:hypothetical protein
MSSRFNNPTGQKVAFESPVRVMKEMKRYTLMGGLLKKVQCPAFISGAGKTLYFDTEAHTMRAFDDLGHLGQSNKTL